MSRSIVAASISVGMATAGILATSALLAGGASAAPTPSPTYPLTPSPSATAPVTTPVPTPTTAVPPQSVQVPAGHVDLTRSADDSGAETAEIVGLIAVGTVLAGSGVVVGLRRR